MKSFITRYKTNTKIRNQNYFKINFKINNCIKVRFCL